MDTALAILWPVAQILLAWYLADLLSGIVHFAFDNADVLGIAHLPVLGRLHATGLLHHADQLSVTRFTFWQTTQDGFVASIPFWPLAYFCPWFWVPFIFGSVLAARVHVWVHWPHHHNGPVVLWLQRWGVILSPRHHAAHHKAPHDRSYCGLNGWADPLLDDVLGMVGMNRRV